jgi:hypothetical protein
LECKVPNGSNTTWYGHSGQGRTVGERRVSDGSDVVSDIHINQSATGSECNAIYIGNTVRKDHRGQIGAASERTDPNGSDAVWDGHGSQKLTLIASAFSNGDDPMRNTEWSRFSDGTLDQGHDGFIIKYAVETNIVQVGITYVESSQGGTGVECIVPDDSDVARDCHGGEGGAALECMAPNGAGAVWDDD